MLAYIPAVYRHSVAPLSTCGPLFGSSLYNYHLLHRVPPHMVTRTDTTPTPMIATLPFCCRFVIIPNPVICWRRDHHGGPVLLPQDPTTPRLFWGLRHYFFRWLRSLLVGTPQLCSFADQQNLPKAKPAVVYLVYPTVAGCIPLPDSIEAFNANMYQPFVPLSCQKTSTCINHHRRMINLFNYQLVFPLSCF